jgi:hypothetical protein
MYLKDRILLAAAINYLSVVVEKILNFGLMEIPIRQMGKNLKVIMALKD